MSVSIDGRFEGMSVRQCERYATMSSSDMDGRDWIRSTGSSSTPTKSEYCAVFRSDPLPLTRSTRWGVPSNVVSVCLSEMFPPFQFVTEGSCPRMCARYMSSSTPVLPFASASFHRFFSIAMTFPFGRFSR
jgi:hypothetical protein